MTFSPGLAACEICNILYGVQKGKEGELLSFLCVLQVNQKTAQPFRCAVNRGLSVVICLQTVTDEPVELICIPCRSADKQAVNMRLNDQSACISRINGATV